MPVHKQPSDIDAFFTDPPEDYAKAGPPVPPSTKGKPAHCSHCTNTHNLRDLGADEWMCGRCWYREFHEDI